MNALLLSYGVVNVCICLMVLHVCVPQIYSSASSDLLGLLNYAVVYSRFNCSVLLSSSVASSHFIIQIPTTYVNDHKTIFAFCTFSCTCNIMECDGLEAALGVIINSSGCLEAARPQPNKDAEEAFSSSNIYIS
jgi:hypothetical protein